METNIKNKVLIVVDDFESRNLIKVKLDHEGFVFFVAGDGGRSLEN